MGAFASRPPVQMDGMGAVRTDLNSRLNTPEKGELIPILRGQNGAFRNIFSVINFAPKPNGETKLSLKRGCLLVPIPPVK